MTNTIQCGNIPGVPHRHSTVDEVRACWDQIEIQQLESAAEIWAEGAWLRAAEAGTVETHAENEFDRMVDALGYGPPLGSVFSGRY